MNLAQDGVPEKGSSLPFGDLIAPPSLAPRGRNDPFTRLWELGYRKLLPIIPPDAEISPNSTLFKKVGLRQDGRGKTPGIRKPNSQWVSFNWLAHDTTEADLARWHAMGAGVGIRTGTVNDELTLVAIDSDARDPQHARLIFAEMERRFGALPLRIGRDPKGLCPLLVRGPFPYSRIEFGERDENGRLIDRVEILSDDKQFVAEGVHPGTGRPYRWQRPLVPLSDLPIVEPEELTAFLDALRPLLPAASAIVGKLGSKNGPAPDQESLIGEFDRIQKAIERLPNTADIEREEYVRIGVALKAAAGPGYEADACNMFVDWAQRWEGAGEETTLHGLAETAEADFRRFHPPFHLGAEYLFAQAIKRSGGAFTAGDAYFDAAAAANEPLFPEDAAEVVQTRALFDFATAARLDRARMEAIPERAFVLGSRFQAGTLTLGAGPAGVSKSTFAIKTALAIATSKALTGETVAKSGRVLIYNAEDPRDEMLRRLMATARLDGLDIDLVQERVRILSGYDDRRLVFAERRDKGGPIRPGQDIDDLARFIAAEGIVHVALDPLVALHRGLDENAAGDMEALGDQLRQFASRTGVSVDLIHHTAKARGAQADANAGQADAARGSGAVMGFVRSAYTLMPMGANFARDLGLEAGRAGQMVRLDDSKRNYARRSARELWFEILSVLPTGEVVSPADFDSRDEAVRRRASTSAGVHTHFDIRRQRALAAISNSESEDLQRSAKLQFVVASMEGDAVSRAALAIRYGVAIGLQDTQAREHINGLVPIGAAKAVEVEADGYAWSVWREQKRFNGANQWVILRKRLGQVVRTEEFLGASDEANGGVFD